MDLIEILIIYYLALVEQHPVASFCSFCVTNCEIPLRYFTDGTGAQIRAREGREVCSRFRIGITSDHCDGLFLPRGDVGGFYHPIGIVFRACNTDPDFGPCPKYEQHDERNAEPFYKGFKYVFHFDLQVKSGFDRTTPIQQYKNQYI